MTDKNYATLTEAFEDRAGDALSVTFIEGAEDESRLTYRQLHQRALVLLGGLQQQGLQPGDELIFFLKNNQAFIEAFWACLLGGIVPVPVAVGISDEHRAKLIRIFRCLEKPHLLIDRKASELLEKYARKSGLEAEHQTIAARTVVWEALADTGAAPGRPHTASPDTLAFIQFSSGSTRDPKGVQLTHRNLLTTVVDLGRRAAYTPDDISLSWMPLTHDLGLIGFHLNMIVFGMTQHIMATELFSRRPLLWLLKVSEKRATVLSSPNFGYRHYLRMYHTRDDHELDLSCVRLILNGAEPISVSLCHEFLDTLAVHGLAREVMYTSYGLAEAALAVSLPIPGHEFQYVTLDRRSLSPGQAVTHVPEDHPQAVRFAVEGPPVERCRVRVGDAHGTDLGEATVGEIQLQGPNVTAGYYNDPEANRDLFTGDGWLRTGDLGLLHEGQLVITGRLKDIIFAHGLNYYPHDLEALALECEGLEMGKVAAVGVRTGESDHDDILICILHRKDLDSFIPYVRAVRQTISEQTGLDVTHVLPVKRIPKTTSGKIQRRFFADAYRAGEFDETIARLNALTPATGRADEPAGPTNGTLAEVMALCAAAIPDKAIAADDNFFEIGLSSLDLAMLQERLEEAYPGRVEMTDFFDHTTIAEVSQLIDRRMAGAEE